MSLRFKINKKRGWVVGALLLVLLAAIGAGVWSFLSLKNTASKKPAVSMTNNNVKSAATDQEREKSLTKVESKLLQQWPDPQAAKSTEITAEKLPEELRKYILPLAKNTKVSSLNYKDGRKGFYIIYSGTMEINLFRQQFVALLGLDMISGRYDDNYSVFEANLKTSDIKILLETHVENSVHTAIIQTVSKK